MTKHILGVGGGREEIFRHSAHTLTDNREGEREKEGEILRSPFNKYRSYFTLRWIRRAARGERSEADARGR